MRTLPSCALALAFLLFSAAPAPGAETRTLVLGFGGDPALGKAVGTIFQLQLLSNLHTPPNRATADVAVLWESGGPPAESIGYAEERARLPKIAAHHVLWGHVYAEGPGTVVTPYLAIPRDHDSQLMPPGSWVLNLKASGGKRTLVADLPKRYYAFEPLVLSPRFVEKYRKPDAFELLTRPGGNSVGRLADEWLFLHREGEYAQVRSNGQESWLFVPELAAHNPAVVDFVSGLIRTYAADWEGAADAFARAATNTSTPTSIKLDSLLFIVRAKTELGLSASADITAIRNLAPPSRRAVQYIAMHLLARCFAPPSRCSKEEQKELTALLERTRPLFLDGDEWFTQAYEIARSGPMHR